MNTTQMKRILTVCGLAMSAAFFMATSVFATAPALPAGSSYLANFESGTNQNNYLYYSYLYDDSKDKGVSTFTNTTKVDTSWTFAPTAGGNPSGTPGYAAKMDFKIGATQPVSKDGYPYGQMVGFGTMLGAAGTTYDLTGATKITFWAKASAAYSMRVELAQADILDFAYYVTNVDLTTSWQQYTILFVGGMTQASWTKIKVPLNLAKAEKIQFCLSAEDNVATLTANATGTFWIDDIIIDKPWKSPMEIASTNLLPAGSGASLGALFADFDKAKVNQQNPLSYYWYCYNDAEGRTGVSIPGTDFSELIDGVTPDPTLPTKPTLTIDANAKGVTGNAAYVSFNLGPTYTQAGVTTKIQPFVGIGTQLSNDPLNTVFFDATACGVTGVYFEYKTTGITDDIRFEVFGNQTFPNVGIVHNILLPPAATWQGAKVMFSDLKLPDWDEVKALSTAQKVLKTSELKKLQWAYQGAPGTKGSLAIDNVVFIGATKICQTGVLNFKKYVSSSNFSAVMKSNKLTVKLASKINTGEASLVSLQGKVVASYKLGQGNTFVLPVNKNVMSHGVYVLKIKSLNGQTSSLMSPVTIME